jgi:hypothetical protein
MKTEKTFSNQLAVGLILIILALTISVLPALTRAQSPVDGRTLEVSPPQQELTIDPGKSSQIKVKVSNPATAKEELSIKARVEDFTAKGDEGQVALTEGGAYSIVNWVTFTPSEFNLKPGQMQEVDATINVPAGSGGGRYGSLVFSATGAAPTITQGEQAVVAQEVASLFLVNVNGPKIEKLTLDTFSAPKFLEFGPVPFTVSYSNSGNVHLKPQGIINIVDTFGKKAAAVVVGGFNVFPGAKRTVTPTWDKKMVIGKFTADAVIYTNGSNNDTLTGTTTFIVFPVRIAVIVILILVVLFLMRNRLAKAFKVMAGGK